MAALFTEYHLIIVDQNADWIALFVHYYPPLLHLIQNYSSVMHFDLNGIRRSFMDNRCAWDRKEIQLQIRKKKDYGFFYTSMPRQNGHRCYKRNFQ